MRTWLFIGISALIVGLAMAIPFEEVRTAGIVVASIGLIIIVITVYFLNKRQGE